MNLFLLPFLTLFISLFQTALSTDIASCLSTGHSITAWYDASSFDTSTNVWSDKSGNAHHASITSGTLSYFDGSDHASNLYLNGQPVVYGTTTTKVAFGSNTNLYINGKHTVINLCKYSGASKRRIIQGSAVNSAFGFMSGQSGVAYENGWITSQTNRFDTKWVLSAQSASFYRGNGADYTSSGIASTRQAVAGVLKINDGAKARETSDFACAEVVIFNDQVLATNEVTCIEIYFAEKYGEKIDTIATQCDDTARAAIDACLATGHSVTAWYDADSFDVSNQVWNDKTCHGHTGTVIAPLGLRRLDGADYVGDGRGITIRFGSAPNLELKGEWTVFYIILPVHSTPQSRGNGTLTLFWWLLVEASTLWGFDGYHTNGTWPWGEPGVFQISEHYQDGPSPGIAEVIIFKDQGLSLEEVECIEDYIKAKYLDPKSVATPSSINAYWNGHGDGKNIVVPASDFAVFLFAALCGMLTAVFVVLAMAMKRCCCSMRSAEYKPVAVNEEKDSEKLVV